MRLLDVHTLELCEFYSSIPPYAILSHTWTDSEVTFEDLGAPAEEKQGYEKIKRCCAQAASDGIQYVWIDTCCVDKRSSADLSENINCMYRYYEKSTVCYVYLSDYRPVEEVDNPETEFAGSRWFTRGWTLQELVAPANVVFFRRDWTEIGTKIDLQNAISRITGIDSRILENGAEVFNASIAQRMSWASERQTTRVEDIAYCLLGIFDINMPLLYGEGSKAFLRLQMELLNMTNDHTIFAWKRLVSSRSGIERRDESADLEKDGYFPLLAPSPLAFRGQSNVLLADEKVTSYHMTNTGLSVALPLIRMPGSQSDLYLAFLNCYIFPSHSRRLCLCLKHEGNFQFSRLGLSEETLKHRRDWAVSTPILILRMGRRAKRALLSILYSPFSGHGFHRCKIITPSGDIVSNFDGMVLSPSILHDRVGLFFQDSQGRTFVVICGVEADGQAWMNIVRGVNESVLRSIVQSLEEHNQSLAHQHPRNRLHKRFFTGRKQLRIFDSKIATVVLRRGHTPGYTQFHLEVKIEETRIWLFSGLQALNSDERVPLLLGNPAASRRRLFDLLSPIRHAGLLSGCLFGETGKVLGGKYFAPFILFVPLGITAYLVHWDDGIVFLCNLVAIPLLGLLFSHFLGVLSLHMGRYDVLMNIFFRCDLELIVSIVALSHSEVQIAQLILLGSIITNLLFTIGICCLASGTQQLEENLNSSEASKMLSLIAVAVAALVMPMTLYASLRASREYSDLQVLLLSRTTALILLVLYGQYVYFQFMSPASFFDDEPIEEEADLESADPSPYRMLGILAILVLITLGLACCSSAIVDSMRGFAALLGTDKTVVGFIFIPLAINARSFNRAVTMAYRNRLGLAIYHVFQNTMQITLFIIPFTVILGWVLHVPMNLHFGGLEVVVFFVSVLVVNHVVQTGKGSYLTGSLCAAT